MKLKLIEAAKRVVVRVKKKGYPTQLVSGEVRRVVKASRSHGGQNLIFVDIGKNNVIMVLPQDICECIEEEKK